MLDHFDVKEANRLSNEAVDLARQYKDVKEKYATAKIFLDSKIASKMDELQKKRKNIGYEMALLTILSEGDSIVQQYYSDYVKMENLAKALDRLTDAYSARISLFQSFVKNKLINEV